MTLQEIEKAVVEKIEEKIGPMNEIEDFNENTLLCESPGDLFFGHHKDIGIAILSISYHSSEDSFEIRTVLKDGENIDYNKCLLGYAVDAKNDIYTTKDLEIATDNALELVENAYSEYFYSKTTS